ncbi:hypothetical protein GF373_12295, partial [bacterium]|nr:hypothetical protein [bacterium]
WYDYNWKSAETVIQNLVDITSKGGNYLLNVGPTGEGLIPPASVRILQEVGKWMEVNGESIYGTQASPIGRLPFHGRCTAKPGKLYIHVFDWPLGRELIVPGIKNAIPRVYLLADQDQILLPFKKRGDDLVLQLQAVNLDEHALHPADTVIAVEYEGELQTARQRLLLDRGFTADLTMDQAAIDGDTLRYKFSHTWDASRGYQIFDWTKVDDAVVFDIRTIRGGAYDVFITYGAAPVCKGNAYALTLGEAAFSLEVQPTGGFYTYNTYHVGEVKIENPGDYTLRIEPEKIGEAQLMNLKGIKLIPIVK